jgi:glutamyl-tRNA reductase
VARAERLAERHGGCALTSDGLGDALADADLVISSTGAPRPVLRRHQVDRARRRRAGSPTLLLIDLAVPRDVDPAVGELAGVELHAIDDLRPGVERALAERSTHLPAADSIVHAEVARFTGWMNRREERSTRSR